MKRIWKKFNDVNHSFGQSIGQWVIKRRWLVIALTLTMAIVAGSGGRFLTFNTDYHVFFSEDNPQLQAFDALNNKYTQDDNVFIVIVPREGEVFTKETLNAIEDLTAKAWKTPYSSRVDAITNFQHTKAVDDDLYVDDLVYGALNKSNQELKEAKQIALNEPLLKDRLIDKEGVITGVNITVKLPGDEMGEEAEVASYVREMVNEFEKTNPHLETYLSGMIMLSGAFGEAAQGDMSTLMPLMFLGIILLIYFTTRSVSGTFSTIIILFFSIMTAMGLAGYLGIELTAPSSATPTIIMTLAIADSIHILITMLQYMRKGVEKKQAIVESLRVNFMPVMITSITTIIGFLTMNFSDAPPFHDLGNITAIGITAALIYSVTTLPALMAVLPVKVKVVSEQKSSNGFISRIAEFVIAYNKRLLWITAISVIGLTAFIIKNELNDEFIKYFDKSIQFRRDTDFISENLTGIYTIEFSLGSGESDGINNPAYLTKIHEFENWFKTQPQVVHVNSFAEVAKRINKSMHGDDPSYYRIPDTRQEAAQFLLLYEMSLPFGLDLNNQVNVDKSETRFIATVENLSSKELIALTQKAENWLKDNAPASMFANGISSSIMFSHLTKRQISSMISGTAVALLMISTILMLALKSFRHGLISLIPNIAPIAVGFGIWGLFVGQINAGMAIVFGMTLGIIVDDTVHFLTKYLRAKREQNKSNEDAIRYAFSTVGTALIVTSIVLIFGFGILAQSGFGMNSSMAKITALTIFLALVIDFLLLPAILLNTAKKQKVSRQRFIGTEKELKHAIGE